MMTSQPTESRSCCSPSSVASWRESRPSVRPVGRPRVPSLETLEDRLVPTGDPYLSAEYFVIFANQTLTLPAEQSLLGNDQAPEGETLLITAINNNAVLVGQPFTLPGSGATLMIDADGTLTCSPAVNGISTDAITYTATAGAFTDSTTVILYCLDGNSVSPTVADIADQENLEGDTVSLAVTASTAGTGSLTYNADWLPSGLTINSATGLISGTIAADSVVSSMPVTVTVSDGTDSAAYTFHWKIESPVTVSAVSAQTNVESDAVSFQVTASGIAGTTMSYTAVNLPAGLSLDSATGWITGTILPGEATPDAREVTIRATDGTYTGYRSLLWTIGSPVSISCQADLDNLEGDGVSLQIIATAPGQTLTYSAMGLPEGLVIDSATGWITGTILPGAANAISSQVTITATDGTYSNTRSFTWTVTSPLTIADLDDRWSEEGDWVGFSVVAGGPVGVSLTYAAENLPDGLSIDAYGQISGTLLPGSATEWTTDFVKITVSGGGYSATRTFRWTVGSVFVGDGVTGVSDTYYVGAGGTLLADSDTGDRSLLANDRITTTTANYTVTAVNGLASAVGNTIVLATSGATLEVDATGRFVYHAAAGYTGQDQFTYTLGSREVTVYVNVASPNLIGKGAETGVGVVFVDYPNGHASYIGLRIGALVRVGQGATARFFLYSDLEKSFGQFTQQDQATKVNELFAKYEMKKEFTLALKKLWKDYERTAGNPVRLHQSQALLRAIGVEIFKLARDPGMAAMKNLGTLHDQMEASESAFNRLVTAGAARLQALRAQGQNVKDLHEVIKPDSITLNKGAGEIRVVGPDNQLWIISWTVKALEWVLPPNPFGQFLDTYADALDTAGNALTQIGQQLSLNIIKGLAAGNYAAATSASREVKFSTEWAQQMMRGLPGFPP